MKQAVVDRKRKALGTQDPHPADTKDTALLGSLSHASDPDDIGEWVMSKGEKAPAPESPALDVFAFIPIHVPRLITFNTLYSFPLLG